MGYAQFIQLEVYNKSTKRSYAIRNAYLEWGKFYRNPDKDEEISADEINKKVIEPQQSQMIASCGRSDAASGTEGSIDIFEGGVKVGTIHWDNPWLTGKSNSVWSDVDGGEKSPYEISVGTYATSGPSIGYVKATIVYSD